jgi:hypothetical protein
MNLELNDNGQIIQVEKIITARQPDGVSVKTPFMGGAMERRISLSAAKTSISVGEQLSIAFAWERFILEIEAYEPDPSMDEINFQVSGQVVDTLQPVNGQDILTFSSAEPGTYVIRTLNPGVNNATLEVVVSA